MAIIIVYQFERPRPYSSSLSNDDIKKDRNDLKDLVENVIIKWITDKANQDFRQTYVIVNYYGNKDLAELLVLFLCLIIYNNF